LTEPLLLHAEKTSTPCRLGYLIEDETQQRGETVTLSEADLLSGITIIGDEAPYTLLQILSQIPNRDYHITVLDYNQTYRNILKADPDARILRAGTDFTLNPFQTQGLNPSEYTELLLLALTQAYQITSKIQNSLRELLIDAYQRAEGRTLTIPELEGVIQQYKESLRASRDHQARATIQTIERTLTHLFQGKTSNTFEAQGATPHQLHKHLTIIELGRYESYSFRTLLQALIIMQFTAHLKTLKTPRKPTIITVDSAEHLFPSRYKAPQSLRQPCLLYKLQETLTEHPNQTIYLTTRHPAELDFCTLHLTKTVIVHQLQTPQDISQTQRNLPPTTPNLWHLKTSQAILKTWTGQTQTLTIQRPSWLYQQKPTNQQIREQLTAEEPTVPHPDSTLREQTSLERDFHEKAWAACQMLEALKAYDGVTRAGLVQTFSTLPNKQAWQIEAKLERQGYIRPVTDQGPRGTQRTILRLNLNGLRAIKEHRGKHPDLGNFPEQESSQPQEKDV